jgi:hypothetical protein
LVPIKRHLQVASVSLHAVSSGMEEFAWLRCGWSSVRTVSVKNERSLTSIEATSAVGSFAGLLDFIRSSGGFRSQVHGGEGLRRRHVRDGRRGSRRRCGRQGLAVRCRRLTSRSIQTHIVHIRFDVVNIVVGSYLN